MKEDFRVIEYFEKSWPQFPKNQIWEETLANGKVQVALACQLQEVRVLLLVVVGNRKGLREKIYALDSSQHFTLDKLIFAGLTSKLDGELLPLSEMRHRIRIEKQDLLAVCREYLGDLLQRMLARPDLYAFLIRQIERGTSVATVSGGSPGLGKR